MGGGSKPYTAGAVIKGEKLRAIARFNANKRTTEERFFQKVVKRNGCWLWKPALKNPDGHAHSFFLGAKFEGKKLITVHHYTYQRYVGEIKEGTIIARICGNNNCVKPAHLFQETRKEYLKRINYKNWLSKLKDCRKCGHELIYYKAEKCRLCPVCYEKKKKDYAKVHISERRIAVRKSYWKHVEKRREERRIYGKKYWANMTPEQREKSKKIGRIWMRKKRLQNKLNGIRERRVSKEKACEYQRQYRIRQRMKKDVQNEKKESTEVLLDESA